MESAREVEWYHGIKPFRLYTDERAFIMRRAGKFLPCLIAILRGRLTERSGYWPRSEQVDRKIGLPAAERAATGLSGADSEEMEE